MCRAITRLVSARRTVLMVCAWLACSGASAQDWLLSAEDLVRLDRREVLQPAAIDQNRNDGNFREAIEIAAPAERVFRTMTDYAQALKFVPHLSRCSVLATARPRSSLIARTSCLDSTCRDGLLWQA